MFTLLYWSVFFHELKMEPCDYLYECIFIMIDASFKEEPLWREALETWYELYPFSWGRFFTDSLFMVFTIKIIGDMFTGIITDKFGE